MGLLSFLINYIFSDGDGFDDDPDFDDDLDFDDADLTFDEFPDESLELFASPDDGSSSEIFDIFPSSCPETDDIPFTGLLDKGLVESRAFSSWEDGVSIFEISPKRIQEIADHIAEEFSQVFPEVDMKIFLGGFATSTQGDGTIFYDVADVVKNSMNGLGGNNIVGSVAHEMGHNIVERVFSDMGAELSDLEHEIGADYIEGIVFGMTGIDPSEKYAFLRSCGESGYGYLPVEDRIDVIKRGMNWGSLLRHLSENAPELKADHTSTDVLFSKLRDVMGDYIKY